MSKEPIFNLSHGAIGRMREVGRSPAGVPIMETRPITVGVTQYDLSGNRVHTPTHSHPAFVKPLDQHTRQRVKADLLAVGYLEEGICPHTPRENSDGVLVPPVTPPPGFTNCDGKGDFDWKTALGGCSHLKTIVLERRANARAAALQRKPPAAKPFSPADAITAILAGLKGQGGTVLDDAGIAKLGEALARAIGGAPAAAATPAPADSLAAGLKDARAHKKETRGEP